MNDCTIFTKPNAVLSSHAPIVGIDEVGRGALFGNMTVGAVILPNELSGRFDEIDLTNTKISLLNDSNNCLTSSQIWHLIMRLLMYQALLLIRLIFIKQRCLG